MVLEISKRNDVCGGSFLGYRVPILKGLREGRKVSVKKCLYALGKLPTQYKRIRFLRLGV